MHKLGVIVKQKTQKTQRRQSRYKLQLRQSLTFLNLSSSATRPLKCSYREWRVCMRVTCAVCRMEWRGTGMDSSHYSCTRQLPVKQLERYGISTIIIIKFQNSPLAQLTTYSRHCRPVAQPYLRVRWPMPGGPSEWLPGARRTWSCVEWTGSSLPGATHPPRSPRTRPGCCWDGRCLQGTRQGR